MSQASASKQFVRDLKERDAVSSFFMATDKMVLTDRNGKTYMSVNLGDSSGTINGRIWDRVDDWAKGFEAGDFVRVKGHVQVYQNRKQVIIHEIEKAGSDHISLKDFVAASLEAPEAMFAKLRGLISSIEMEPLRQLMELVIADEDVKSRLLKAPAAKTIHHAYMGGLLEHILSICGVMESLAKHYKFLNRDLLIFGAIFHDLGKVFELSVEEGIKYTDRGRLVGHMAIACEIIDQKAQTILGFPADLKDILKHIVLSHHGKLEYGSPKEPALPEAMVVAIIDDLDSKLNTVYSFMKSELATGESWTRLNTQFGRYFYLDFLREKERPSEA